MFKWIKQATLWLTLQLYDQIQQIRIRHEKKMTRGEEGERKKENVMYFFAIATNLNKKNNNKQKC